MLKLFIFLNFLFASLLLGSTSSAAEICEDTSTSGVANQSRTLWKASCVAECSQVLNKKSADQVQFFEKNCADYDERKHKELNWEDSKKAIMKADEAASQCLSLGLKKAVMTPIELAKAIPGLVGYLLSGAWTKNFSGEAAIAYDLCKDNPDCRRGVARNTVRFSEKNPDGSYRVSDAEVDKQIASQHFMDLQNQANHDIPLIQNECMGYLGTLRRNMASDGEDWTEERHNKVKNQLSQQHPHCPQFLKLNEVRQAKADSDPKVEEACLVREKENPGNCLSMFEKVRVGLQCFGDEYREGMWEGMKEACSEVVATLVPLPGIAEAKVAFVAAKGVIRKEAVTIAADASRAAGAVDGPAGLAIVEPRAMSGSADAVKAAELTPSQRSFVQSYRSKVYVEEAQNQRYITLAENSAKEVAENKTRYFDVENSVMKKLNDKTNDKELVTSLTNYQKETVLKRMDGLKAKYPDIDFEVYSDFKSVKIAMKSDKPIDAATHEKLLADLNKLYGESNKEFAAKLKDLKIEVPDAGTPDQWFKAGYGRSVEEAAIAARNARQNRGVANVLDYSTPEVKQAMQKTLSSVEQKRQALETSSSFAPLMEKTSGGAKLPKEEVFDLVRKNDSPDALAKAISQRYELKNFTAADAAQLQDYAKGVDEFSPTILVPKRETVNLDDAAQGGLSADFLGMGSANMRATAEGIAGKSSVEKALIGAREGEKRVTQTFKQRMENFKKIVGDAKCTGDDCAMAKLMSDADKTKMMQKLARNPETRGVRMSFIGGNVSKDTRMQLASHGESIEKAFRKELAGKIPAAKLDKMTFGFDMKSTTLGQGQVNLVVGKTRGTSLSAKEQIEMQQAFARAVEKNNAAKGAAYSQGSSVSTQNKLIWIPGANLLGVEDDREP